MSPAFSPPPRTFCNSGWSCMETVRDKFEEMYCGIACTFTIQLDNVKTEPTLQTSKKHSREQRIDTRDVRSRKPENPEIRRIGAPRRPPRFVPPKTPQVAKPGKICRLGMSSIGKSHRTGRGGAQPQDCQRGARCRGRRICPNRVISKW